MKREHSAHLDGRLKFACLASIILLHVSGIFMHQASAGVEVWTKTAYANVFRDEIKTPASSDSIIWVAARNEVEGSQILVRSDADLLIHQVRFSDLSGKNSRINKEALSYNFVDYHYLVHNSSIAAPVRRVPDWFPDDLSNDASRKVAAQNTQPVWIRVHVPKDATPGIYHGTASVLTSAGKFNVPIMLTVCDVTLPECKDGILNTEFWWSPFRSSTLEQQGCAPYSEKWWSLIDIYAASFKDYRVNHILIPILRPLLDAGSSCDAAGRYTFHWSLFDQLVERFVKKGGVKRLAGEHLMSRTGSWTADFGVSLLKKDNGQTLIIREAFGAPQANNWLAQFLPALKAHLQEKGWYDIWYQHIADEPTTMQHVASLHSVADSVRKHFPRMLIGDAVETDSVLASLTGAMDIWTAKIINYEHNMVFFQSRKKAGESVWLYTCCGPKDAWLNRFIDSPVWHMRSLAWLCYLYDVNGFLHWGWNHNDVPVEQQQYCVGYSPGDANSVYADSVRGTIKGSIRYEAWRDAVEEYELLKILELKDAVKARSIAAGVIKSGQEYESDPAVLIQRRNELVMAASAASSLAPLKPDANFISSPADLKKRIKHELNITKPDYVVYVPSVTDANVNDTGNEHFLVFDGPNGSLMAVWTQSSAETQPDQHIAFSRSADEGKTWSKPSIIAGPKKPGEGFIASWAYPLVSKKGRIYVLYSQHMGIYDNFYHHTGWLHGIYSDDNGRTWSKPQNIPVRRSINDNPDPNMPPNMLCWQKPLRLGKDGKYFAGFTRWTSFAVRKNPTSHWTSADSRVEFMRFENVDDDPEPGDLQISWFAADEKALAVPYPGHAEVSACQEPSVVKLPDGRLFCVMRTASGSPFWSVSDDLGETWTEPRRLLRQDGGQPLLHPLSPCPMYDLGGNTSASGRYVLFIHNHDGHYKNWKPSDTGYHRRPIYLVLGTFKPGADQPIWFEEPKFFMDHKGVSLGKPGTNGRLDLALYSSFTLRQGLPVLWYPERKFFLLGKKLVPESFPVN
jgi:hypothetical protein